MEAFVKFDDNKFGFKDKKVVVQQDMPLDLKEKDLLVNSLKDYVMSFRFDGLMVCANTENNGNVISVSITIDEKKYCLDDDFGLVEDGLINLRDFAFEVSSIGECDCYGALKVAYQTIKEIDEAMYIDLYRRVG